MNDSNNRFFLGLTALFGGAGAALRYALFHTALDHKGLLIPLHPTNLGLWAVAIVFTVLVWRMLPRRIGDNGRYCDSFTPCTIRCGLSLLAAAALACSNGWELFCGNTLVGILGLLAAAGMAAGGICRLKGKQPLPLFHILVCVFFIVRLVTNFRGWSADPQFQDYAMQLLACVNLMLFAFHRSSADADLLDREAVARYSLLAACFCTISLTDTAMPLVYAAGALWAIGAGPSLQKLETAETEE